MIEKRPLGKTGLSVSEISLGGVALGWLGKKRSTALINFCLDRGINYIDTYNGTGKHIGGILKKRRKDFLLSTRGNSKTIDSDLKQLNVDFFDIFFLSMVDSVEQYKAATREAHLLDKAKRAGRFRFLGIATHNPSLYSRIIREGVFPVVMFPLNCVDEISEKVFSAAGKKKVGIIAMKPLAGGNLTNYRAALRFALSKKISTAVIGIASIKEAKEDIKVLGNKTITGQDKLYYKQIRKKLGKTFCRYCGHCIFPDPCPVGIPVRIIMMLKTLAYQSHLRRNTSAEQLAKVKDCIRCGKCEERCPYDLPIRELLPRKVDEYLQMTKPRKA